MRELVVQNALKMVPRYSVLDKLQTLSAEWQTPALALVLHGSQRDADGVGSLGTPTAKGYLTLTLAARVASNVLVKPTFTAEEAAGVAAALECARGGYLECNSATVAWLYNAALSDTAVDAAALKGCGCLAHIFRCDRARCLIAPHACVSGIFANRPCYAAPAAWTSSWRY